MDISWCLFLLGVLHVGGHPSFYPAPGDGDVWQPGDPWQAEWLQEDLTDTRTARSVISAADRRYCQDGENPPLSTDTSARLDMLRDALADTSRTKTERPLSAYYIPMSDAHQNEYVSSHDQLIQFISGFSGSAGIAIVLNSTYNQAALWTDGRYFLQGEQQLDCNWILMKRAMSRVPSPTGWLREILPPGSLVGADPTKLGYEKWVWLSTSLSTSMITLVEVPGLLDRTWDEYGDRPPVPSNPIFVHDIKFAGVSWEDKVSKVQVAMSGLASAVVLSALDEIAWLYNLRGTDIEYNPVFFSYSIIFQDKVRLYLRNVTGMLSEDSVRTHLNTGSEGECGEGSGCVEVLEYDTFFPDLRDISRATADPIWVSPMSSYAVLDSLTDGPVADDLAKAFFRPSKVRSMKAIKNPTEVEGMKNAHIRDSAALIEFIAMLEKEVQAGKNWTEITAAAELARYRGRQQYNRGLSFPAISASGSNGAIIHYTPTPDTDTPITTKHVYLLDSGGQYLDGTTDVTRTFHFGQPDGFQKEMYTRVLMGSIDLASFVWPGYEYGHMLDSRARGPLWEVGLDYRHGTGHGIGAFLYVHEDPGGIKRTASPGDHDAPLQQFNFLSDEPGYYEAGRFGIRLETILMVKKIATMFNFDGAASHGFQAFTLVPFEPKMMNYELLSLPQRKWLNAYNQRVLREVGEDVLKKAGKLEAYQWVVDRTHHIPDEPIYTSASLASYPHLPVSIATVTVALLFLLLPHLQVL